MSNLDKPEPKGFATGDTDFTRCAISSAWIMDTLLADRYGRTRCLRLTLHPGDKQILKRLLAPYLVRVAKQ